MTKAKPSKARELDDALKSRKSKNVKPHLVPVHISVEEVIGFNSLQASEENPTGQYVQEDVPPEEALREYSRLSNVLRIPKIRDLFIQTTELFLSDEPVPKEIEDIQKLPMPGEENGLIPIPSDSNPAVQQIADTGTGEDKILVMMPQDVVHFLDILQGGKNEDPTLGLQQFGFFSKASDMFKDSLKGKVVGPFSKSNFVKSGIRVVATVVGGAAGYVFSGFNPAGAAAGAYAGNMIGRYTTGQKIGGKNPAWRAAAPNALYGYGAGAAAGLAGYGAASAAGAGAGAGAGAAGASTAAPAAAASVAPAVAPAVVPAVVPAATGLSAITSSPYFTPGLLMAGGYMMSRKGDKEQKKEYEKEKEEHGHKIRDMNDISNQRLETQLYEQPEMSDRTRYGYNYGKYRKKTPSEERQAFKKGGSVKILSIKGSPLKGPGKGQEDLIHRTIPEYTWIHDAHTVSALGDGTTEAGHKEIHAFEDKIRKEMLPKYKEELMRKIKEKKPRQVPCAVANGEHETPLLLVGALGEGSFDEGAKRLRKITREIRRHKTSNKHDLPPAAHELTVYLKKTIKGK